MSAGIETAAFLAGATSSLGPCTAPRLLALSAVCGGVQRRWAWRGALAFAGGLCTAYALLGAFGAAAIRAFASSPQLFVLLAIVAIAGAVRAVVREPHTATCSHATLGGGFLAGFLSAGTGAACCAPMAIFLAQTAVAGGGPAFVAVVLACFALGQSLPLFAVAGGWNAVGGAVERVARAGALGTVNAGVLLALGGYYALLA